MNIRMFWVRAMKCMCAQTRPRFILSSKTVFWGMEFEPMLTPREKSLLPENVPRGGLNPRRCGQRAQTLPTELFRPPILPSERVLGGMESEPMFNSKGKIHCTKKIILRGWSNPRRCIKQKSEPNTLPRSCSSQERELTETERKED